MPARVETAEPRCPAGSQNLICALAFRIPLRRVQREMITPRRQGPRTQRFCRLFHMPLSRTIGKKCDYVGLMPLRCFVAKTKGAIGCNSVQCPNAESDPRYFVSCLLDGLLPPPYRENPQNIKEHALTATGRKIRPKLFFVNSSCACTFLWYFAGVTNETSIVQTGPETKTPARARGQERCGRTSRVRTSKIARSRKIGISPT